MSFEVGVVTIRVWESREAFASYADELSTTSRN
jgi:hypothetical protein